MPSETKTAKSRKSRLSTDYDAILKRLEALEDEREIREVLHRYTHTIDYGPGEGCADVFTRDGVFDVCTVDGQAIHREDGLKEVVNYFSSKELPPANYDKHLILSPVISVKGNEAKVESYWLFLQERPETGTRIAAYGRYHDTLVKRNGKWLIKERLAEVESGYKK